MHAKQLEWFSEFRLITSVPLILLIIAGAFGRLTEAPRNNFIFEGSTAEFTCCSDIQSLLFWEVKPVGSQSTSDINDIFGLINGFRKFGRFNITDGSHPGCYKLTIRDVKQENAGTYTCIDEEGLGQTLSWELVIVESFNCEEINGKTGYIGENNFGLPQNVISAVCISKYYGNIPTKPRCEWSSGTKLLDNYVRVTDKTFTRILNIQMPASKEFNGDQLSCKTDQGSIYNQTPIAWKSSNLIINYASFHQRGVQQCSIDELSLDCNPPCDNKMLRFSNGSFYCEIAYPSHTHKKVYVLLQDTNLPLTTFIPTTPNPPVEHQAQSAGILPIVTAVLVTVIICFALGGAIVAVIATIIIKRKRRLRLEKTILEMNALDPNSNEERRLRLEKTILEMNALDPNSNEGRYGISKPGIVINMGDGNNVTINTVYGDQGSPVIIQQENIHVPLLREFKTTELNRTPSLDSETESASVRGVAVLGELLIFAYKGSSKLRVYSANTLGYKTSWELKELTRPQDVTACNKNSCLYISNIKLTSACEIFKVHASAEGNLIKKWETGRNYFGRLSVTHDCNVLLAVYSNRRLVEYNPDGIHLKEIQLPDALYPNYAMKVNSDYYFVSHGFSEHHVHGVSQVDANGVVLNRFGNTKGSTNEQLNTPVHLVMKDGSIWVADSNNGRVVALSSSLEYQATLLSKEEDELSRPLRICLDQANRRLLLSDLQNQNHFLRAFNFI